MICVHVLLAGEVRSGKQLTGNFAMEKLPDDPETLKRMVNDLRARSDGGAEEERFRLVVESSPTGIVVSNTSGDIVMVNRAAEELFGYSRDEFLQLRIENLVPDNLRTEHPKLREGFQRNPQPRAMGHGRDLSAVRKDGIEIKVEIALTPLPVDGEILILSSIVDITGRKEAEEKLQKYSAELKRSQAEIVRISENEQRRIGQDLHDDLCSQLSGIGCLTKVLEQTLGKENPETVRMLQQVSGMISQAGTKAREIAKGLVPTVLETRGLASALEDMVVRKNELFGVECDVFLSGRDWIDQFDQAVSVQLYRIAQEAVSNAIKHSDADEIRITVSGSPEGLVIEISDDGKGMSPGQVSDGMGLLTMQRRAEIIGADFTVDAVPGEGSTLSCKLSFPSHEI